MKVWSSCLSPSESAQKQQKTKLFLQMSGFLSVLYVYTWQDWADSIKTFDVTIERTELLVLKEKRAFDNLTE